MKIQVIIGTIADGKVEHVAGTDSAVFEIDDAEGERMISLGIAKRLSTSKTKIESASEKKAREEAEKATLEARVVLEAKAVKKGVGTVEEVSVLADDELAELLKEDSE